MSIFSELLWKQFPNVDYPGIDRSSINKLAMSWKYNSLYHTSVRLIYHIYLLPYDDNKSSYKNKFEVLNDIILDNKQLSLCESEYFFNKFYETQRAYCAFRRLTHYYKHKYGKRFEIDADLCFNAFSQLSPKITISLLENNIIYKFRISDLINIINKSLTNAPLFFAEPIEIKNPYTNLPFTQCNLYNIYFKIRDLNYVMPILFQQYFSSNFDLIRFKNHNECFVREKAIENFIRDASIDEKYQYILRMFYLHYRSIYFKIDPYFPRSKIVNVFKNYLHLFLLEEYSLNPHVRETNRVQLEYNLTLFSQLNPEFGKRIWIRKRPSTTHSTYSFHDNVVTSYETSNSPPNPTPRTLTPIEYATSFRNDIIPSTTPAENNTDTNEADDADADAADDIDDAVDDDEADEYDPENDIAIPTDQPNSISATLLRYRRSYLVQNNDAMADYLEPVDDTDISETPPPQRNRTIDQILRDII